MQMAPADEEMRSSGGRSVQIGVHCGARRQGRQDASN
jgi:hypothetical protein